MNAIVALCHFCDHHGPRVMMCTQAFHGTLDAQLLFDSTQPPRETKVKEDVTITTTGADGSVYSSHHICDACRSFPEGRTGIISHDAKANVYYVSTQRPLEKDSFVIARQACLGSLTFEGPEGFEGPMLFGENPDIYVLSYQFFLTDSKARGKRRRYSLIVVMKDRFYLISSWTFIVNNFRRIIKSWQDRAAKVYTKETGIECAADDKSKSLDNMRWNPKPSFPRRSLSKDEVARPLVQLINHKGVFLDLHQDLMTILQEGSCQWEERQVEWPPASPKPRPPPPQPLEESPMASSDGGWEVLGEGRKGSLESVVSSCELADRRLALERESVNGAAVRSLKHLYQLTGHSVFTRLAYHTLKGDLVIVRGCEKTTVASVLSLLATLIPERCCKTVVYSTKYDESYRYTCNLLGLAVGQEVPDSVCNAKDCVILDIYPPLEDSYSSPSPPSSTPSSASSGSDSTRSERLSKYKFLVSNKPSSEQPGQPSLLQQYIKVLTNPHFSDILVDQFVTCAKREWLNKAKLLYRLSKSGLLNDESQRDDKLPQIQALLQLQAGKSDLDILRFWFSGISEEERIQIMSYA